MVARGDSGPAAVHASTRPDVGTALVLSTPAAHRGQSYTLAGPRPVLWSELTDVLTRVLGRPIHYVPASVIGYVRHLSRRGLPQSAVLVQTILHFLLRFGQGATEDPTLERLLGRPARTVEQYIVEHAALWGKNDLDRERTNPPMT